MSEQIDRRADTTRQQILRAASRQFAHKPYSLVSLDDILADAEVTKGALYFHFRSKYALASAIVEHRAAAGRTVLDQLLAQKLSGLETLIDISYLIAFADIRDESTRAGFNLVESIGRTEGLSQSVLGDWMATLTEITRKALDEGDIVEKSDPADIAQLLVSMYLGLRQTSDLGKPEVFVRDLETLWALLLPGFVKPDRIAYLMQFIKRRAAVAARKATPPSADEL